MNKEVLNETVLVKVKRLHKDAVLPKKASDLAGGFDVTAVDIEMKGKDLAICNIGFAMQFPDDFKLTLVPRSGLTKTTWVLQNTPGLGDPDYRGPYQFRFRAIPNEILCDSEGIMTLGYSEFPYKKGERIGQIYLERIIPTEFVEVDELDETERGEGGFGSTGNKSL